MIFGKNYLEELVVWVGNILEPYNPVDVIFDFIFNNRLLQYGNKCLEELTNDIEIAQSFTKRALSSIWKNIKRLFNSKDRQLQVSTSKQEPQKITDEKKTPKKEKELNREKNISDKKETTKIRTSPPVSENSELAIFKKDKIEEEDLNGISTSEEKISVKKPNQSKLFDTQKPRKRVPIKNIDWLEVNKKRIEIGEIGELIVIKFERQRLSNLGILNPEKYIIHASKEVGDGLGYDITSIDQDKSKIFIEVKTTSSSNSFEIIITKNELETMNELKDNYFIYIVNCSSSESAIVKRLSYDLIKRNFNLIPDRFKLKEK